MVSGLEFMPNCEPIALLSFVIFDIIIHAIGQQGRAKKESRVFLLTLCLAYCKARALARFRPTLLSKTLNMLQLLYQPYF